MIHTTAQLHVVCCNNIKEHPSEFHSILASTCSTGVRAKRTKSTSVTTSAVSGSANNHQINNDANLTKSQKKHHKWKTNTQANSRNSNKLDAAIAQNQQYQEILNLPSRRSLHKLWHRHHHQRHRLPPTHSTNHIWVSQGHHK